MDNTKDIAFEKWIPALPLAKILMNMEQLPLRRKLMEKRLSIFYSSDVMERISLCDASLTDSCDFLSKCDVETQYESMKLILRLVVFDGVISVDHMKFLRQCMKGMRLYLVKHLELYYAPLEQGWASERVFAIPPQARGPYLARLNASSEDVHRQFSLLMRHTASTMLFSQDQEKVLFAQDERKEYVDAYCELFGLYHYFCPELLATSYERPKSHMTAVVALAIYFNLAAFLISRSEGTPMYLLSFVISALIVFVYFYFWNLKIANSNFCLADERFEKDRENVFPLIAYVCQLNTSARKHQVRMLRSIYTERIDIYLEEKVSYSDVYEKILICKELEYEKRRDLVDLLFRLAVEDDGIKNDEWYFLKSILSSWRFSDTFVSYYVNRYGSLRTEFDEQSDNFSGNSSQSSTSCYLGNYYRTLGLEESASDEEVKRAYHALALQHHPDLPKNAGRKVECEALMAKINEAYAKICG